ncbi:ribonuclease HII [Deltaproteobacteria bacterium OttesenSCG-928-M10]|nr:ribonuclease HII [Deltaproteobacteria bacterium OttesenSCG-928-M10]
MKETRLDENLSPVEFDAFFRERGALLLAGTDEAGRGPLAGPVVAAAVILDPAVDYPGLGDSKKLSPAARDKAFDLIAGRALSWAWAKMEAAEVDRLNPLMASMAAMAKAVAGLASVPDLVLVDGGFAPPLNMALKTVVKGDRRSQSIGAASIMAKVIRDRIMLELDRDFPQYGFARHKGYGTAAHLTALRRHGPCPCHRLTYRGVKPEVAAEPAFDFGL